MRTDDTDKNQRILIRVILLVSVKSVVNSSSSLCELCEPSRLGVNLLQKFPYSSSPCFHTNIFFTTVTSNI
jgi:hypothetical protein